MVSNKKRGIGCQKWLSSPILLGQGRVIGEREKPYWVQVGDGLFIGKASNLRQETSRGISLAESACMLVLSLFHLSLSVSRGCHLSLWLAHRLSVMFNYRSQTGSIISHWLIYN